MRAERVVVDFWIATTDDDDDDKQQQHATQSMHPLLGVNQSLIQARQGKAVSTNVVLIGAAGKAGR